MPLAPLMLLAAIAAAPTPTQQTMLERALACPESLPDDAARIRNTDRFNRLYEGIAPAARSGERMAIRGRLLAKKRCDPDRDHLQHSLPES